MKKSPLPHKSEKQEHMHMLHRERVVEMHSSLSRSIVDKLNTEHWAVAENDLELADMSMH